MIRKAVVTLAVAIITVSAAAIDKRLVGGEEAKDDDLLSIVSVSKEAQGHHVCGGTLLDSTTVLTAAHCLSSAYYVRAGIHDISKTAVVGKIAFVKEHPEYIPGSKDSGPVPVNDIAILKLSTPIAESDKIKYATLPETGSDPVVNSTAVTAGWGGEVGGVSAYTVDKLRKAVIPVRAREDCSKAFPGAAGRDTIVCAGGDGKTVARYDSGGPLTDKKTGHLIGVVSGGAVPKYPSVFTRVGSYIPFITEYLGSVSNPDPNAPSRTEAYEAAKEAAAEANKLWYQQVTDHCQKTGENLLDCKLEAEECRGLEKPDGKMDEVYQCVDERLEKLKKWDQEQANSKGM